MKENLKDIFLIIRDWLRFAEEKNAALIALNLVSIFGATTIITQSKNPLPIFILYYLFSFIIFNGLGLIIALYSFWPQSHSLIIHNQEDIVFKISNEFLEKIEGKSSKNMQDTKHNSLYYGHIKYCDVNEYLAKLYEPFKKEEYSNLEWCYASQIVTNSRIAFRKYFYFKVALFCTLSALLTPVISVIFALFIKTINSLIREEFDKCFIYFLLFVIISYITVWNLLIGSVVNLL